MIKIFLKREWKNFKYISSILSIFPLQHICNSCKHESEQINWPWCCSWSGNVSVTTQEIPWGLWTVGWRRVYKDVITFLKSIFLLRKKGRKEGRAEGRAEGRNGREKILLRGESCYIKWKLLHFFIVIQL